jgi:biopolymer transport protein ExbB
MFHSILFQIANTGGAVVNQLIDTANSAAAQMPLPTELPKQTSLSLLDLIIKGGPIMIPMGILSCITIYFFFERYLTLKKSIHLDDNFMNSIKDFINSGNLDAAKALCRNTTSPVARMIERGVSRIGKPIKEIEESMENVGKLQINHLEKNLSILSLIGRIAPILGFVGTIAGVIKIFYDISLTDNISIGVISGGLYQKMITSASGLIIGLIAFIGYYFLNAMLDKIINKMETASVQFLDILHEPTK